MILKKIQIKNFRSIKDVELTFSENCIILLGKNEAGKSNLLKAIASIFGKYKVSDKDKRKRIENEKINEYCNMAVFTLLDDDFRIIASRFNQKYSGTENIIFTSNLSLYNYIKKVFFELLIRINIGDGQTPYFSYWKYDKSDVELEIPLFLTGTKIDTSGTGEFDLLNSIFKIITEYYSENPINCHYWQYSDEYLLPAVVSIKTFKENPEKYRPLQNIFALCDRENIKEEFNSALLEDGDYSNLLDQVSRKVTSTFQRIWKDFKNTSIQILPNGEEALIKVVDKVKYSFEDRSDGFKKFISILLMLSTRARVKKTEENELILIDEPDQSLYPTSAQYLRDELLEISKKSNLVFSTHSQFMIDTNCLERHIVVEKREDITTIRREERNAPFSNDELLRRAIGASIFECLKPCNIIFEGYLDKVLFEKYCRFHNRESEFQSYGRVYLGGISGVETLVQLLILANKKFLIVADSDETSKNKQVDFEKKYPDYKNCWLGYADICPSITTMEDFLKTDFLINLISNNGYPQYKYDAKKSAINNIEKATENNKQKTQELKSLLVDNITNKNLNEGYNTYIKELLKKIKSL